MVIRPDAFMPIDQYLAQVEHAYAALKAAPSLDATRPVLLPGEPEQIARAERTANSIPMAEATWQSLYELSDSLGVAVA
jgi:LDH2 family malate/lactate/ureidoglycolate dehydrogenase